jgi:hypothetical protein
VPNITIELTDAQYKGLEYAALSPQDWIDNAVTNRARISNDEIIKLAMEYYLDNEIQAPTTRDAIIADAFERGIVKTAAQRQEEFESRQDV